MGDVDDPWARQRALGRTTTVWAATSIAVGVVAATRTGPWWRGFGHQHVSWGAIDLAIVGVAGALQHRRMRRLGDPYEPSALAHERRWLRRVLVVNVVADAGYVIGGVALWRGRPEHLYAAGAGAAITLQGTFLMVHDAQHAIGASSQG